MARYSLNLPQLLKQEAEQLAGQQGISLNQFILWAVAEKVGAFKQQLDNPKYPQITYRRGSSGVPTAIIRGTGIRVQTIVIAHHMWGMSPEELKDEYDLKIGQVKAALEFYVEHKKELDLLIESEAEEEQGNFHVETKTSS